MNLSIQRIEHLGEFKYLGEESLLQTQTGLLPTVVIIKYQHFLEILCNVIVI